MYLAWQRGIGIGVLAFAIALGVHAPLLKAEAAQQLSRGQSVDQGMTDPALVGALDVHARAHGTG
jgi:hypothetical protein